jgi:hypothetical protein
VGAVLDDPPALQHDDAVGFAEMHSTLVRKHSRPFLTSDDLICQSSVSLCHMCFAA